MFLGKSENTAGPEISKIRTPEKKPVESKQVGLSWFCLFLAFPLLINLCVTDMAFVFFRNVNFQSFFVLFF